MKIYFDGGIRKISEESYLHIWGIAVYDEKNNFIHKNLWSETLSNISPQYAEMMGALEAFRYAALFDNELLIFGDSLNVFRLLERGDVKLDHACSNILQELRLIEEQYPKIATYWIPREENKADKFLNKKYGEVASKPNSYYIRSQASKRYRDRKKIKSLLLLAQKGAKIISQREVCQAVINKEVINFNPKTLETLVEFELLTKDANDSNIYILSDFGKNFDVSNLFKIEDTL